MRSSYRPRNSSHGHRGEGRGASKGVTGARVAVPKPVQTSSIKAESGVFDLTTILVPAASKGDQSTWGKVSNKKDPEQQNLVDTSRETASPTSEPPSSVASEHELRTEDVIADKSYPPPTQRSETTAASASNERMSGQHPNIVEEVVGQSVPVNATAFPPPQRRPIHLQPATRVVAPARSPQVHTHQHLAPARLSEELFPPLSMVHQLENNVSYDSSNASKLDSNMVEPEEEQETNLVLPAAAPAPRVFQTPAPEEADTEEEKERRRRSLALEQQRLILKQVEAARAAKVKQKTQHQHHKPVNAIMRRNLEPKNDEEEVKPPVQPTVTRKGPRTKGRLYSRLADGTLVEDISAESSDLADESDTKHTSEESSELGEPTVSESKEWKSVNGQSTNRKSWGSKNRRPKKHQVAAVDG